MTVARGGASEPAGWALNIGRQHVVSAQSFAKVRPGGSLAGIARACERLRVAQTLHVYPQYRGDSADRNVRQERQSVFNSVFAYVDPGVGATVLQLALAGTVCVGALVKLRWKSVKRVVGRRDEPAATPEKVTEPPQ